MDSIFIDDEYITLTQFLKKIDLISSGGQAKFFLQETAVFVNNELEDRRGKKLYSGDVVRIDDDEFVICT